MEYSNLKIIIDPTGENEIIYNYQTGQATVYAKTEDDVPRCVAELEARGLLKAWESISDDEKATALLKRAFDNSLLQADEKTRETALQLCRECLGVDDAKSPAYMVMFGFLMGVSEGMRIAKTMLPGKDDADE